MVEEHLTKTFSEVMENVSRLFNLIEVLSLSFCLLWIPSNAEVTTVTATVESLVFLSCKNESLDSLSQLIWSKDKNKLVTFASQKPIHLHPEAHSLSINMSLSEETKYALRIDKVQKVHAGNYKCETLTGPGLWEKNWILTVKDKDKEDTKKSSRTLIVNIVISTICVGVVFVVCVTLLLFRRIRKSNRRPEAAETEQDIYENCLGRHLDQSHHVYSN